MTDTELLTAFAHAFIREATNAKLAEDASESLASDEREAIETMLVSLPTPPQTSHCVCRVIREGGDYAPRMWQCTVHGKTGMMGLYSVYETFQKRFKNWDQFWDVAYGIYQEREASRFTPGEIYNHRHLWRDIRNRLEQPYD